MENEEYYEEIEEMEGELIAETENEQPKNGVKQWFKKNRKKIVVGTAVVLTGGLIIAARCAKKRAEKKEAQEIIDDFELVSEGDLEPETTEEE